MPNFNAVSRTNAIASPVNNADPVDSTGTFRISYDEYTTIGDETGTTGDTITFGSDVIPAGSRVCFAILEGSATAGIAKTVTLAVGTASMITSAVSISGGATLNYSDTHGRTVDAAAYPVLTLAAAGDLTAGVVLRLIIFYVID